MTKGIIKRSCFILGVYLILSVLFGLPYLRLRALWIQDPDTFSRSEATSAALRLWTDNLCGPLVVPASRPGITAFEAFAEGFILILIFALPILGYLIRPSWLTGFLAIISLVVWFVCGYAFANVGV